MWGCALLWGLVGLVVVPVVVEQRCGDFGPPPRCRRRCGGVGMVLPWNSLLRLDIVVPVGVVSPREAVRCLGGLLPGDVPFP